MQCGTVKLKIVKMSAMEISVLRAGIFIGIFIGGTCAPTRATATIVALLQSPLKVSSPIFKGGCMAWGNQDPWRGHSRRCRRQQSLLARHSTPPSPSAAGRPSCSCFFQGGLWYNNMNAGSHGGHVQRDSIQEGGNEVLSTPPVCQC